MRKFLAPLAGAMLVGQAPAAASAQPAAATQPPAPPFVVYVAPPRVPGRPPVPGKVISLAPTTTPVDPTALALAHQILTIAFPPEKRAEVFASRMDSVVEQVRKNIETLGTSKDKEFQALVDHSTQRVFEQMKVTIGAALPDIFESMARAYAREFSTDDLNAILAFVKTPAGQHYFERAPQTLKDPDVQAATQRMMTQMMAKLPEITRANTQEIEDYVARKAKQEKAAARKPVA